MARHINVNLIAAVGQRGQLGLQGRLPWHDAKDLRRFRERTQNSVVVVGFNTWSSVRQLDGTYNRYFLVDGAEAYMGENYGMQPWDFETPIRVARALDMDTVWIAGGAKTYAKWAPHVESTIVTMIDYDGEADTWFPWDAYPKLADKLLTAEARARIVG